MVQAICQEVSLQKGYLGKDQISTIYFGGGTPSQLSAEELSTIMSAISLIYNLIEVDEVTLEANPDDLTSEKLSDFKALGITRLSIGIQSFQDSVLQFLNRSHNALIGIESVQRARRAGFSNISIDLIYAIPNLSLAEWDENIRQAIALDADHISAYTLTIEPNTVFGRLATKGKLGIVPDEIAASQMELLIDRLAAGGYYQYEVSNFCKPNKQSQHNSNYWSQEKYLGVGPSAHSYNGTSRQFNISNNHLYLSSLNEGRIPCELEVLTINNKINEYILTSLRTVKGCDLHKLRSEFNFDLQKERKGYLEELMANGLAQMENGILILTRQGRLLADKIASDLFEIGQHG